MFYVLEPLHVRSSRSTSSSFFKNVEIELTEVEILVLTSWKEFYQYLVHCAYSIVVSIYFIQSKVATVSDRNRHNPTLNSKLRANINPARNL